MTLSSVVFFANHKVYSSYFILCNFSITFLRTLLYCTLQCTRVHLCAIPNVDVTNFLKCLSQVKGNRNKHIGKIKLHDTIPIFGF